MCGPSGSRRTIEFGAPGPLRRQLTDLVLSGQKTATAGLFAQEYASQGEPVERIGEELIVLGDGAEPLAVIEVDSVDVLPFAQVGWEFADAEGEGFSSVEHWRQGHLAYWASQGWPVRDDTLVVCVHFHLSATALPETRPPSSSGNHRSRAVSRGPGSAVASHTCKERSR